MHKIMFLAEHDHFQSFCHIWNHCSTPQIGACRLSLIFYFNLRFMDSFINKLELWKKGAQPKLRMASKCWWNHMHLFAFGKVVLGPLSVQSLVPKLLLVAKCEFRILIVRIILFLSNPKHFFSLETSSVPLIFILLKFAHEKTFRYF